MIGSIRGWIRASRPWQAECPPLLLLAVTASQRTRHRVPMAAEARSAKMQRVLLLAQRGTPGKVCANGRSLAGRPTRACP